MSGTTQDWLGLAADIKEIGARYQAEHDKCLARALECEEKGKTERAKFWREQVEFYRERVENSTLQAFEMENIATNQSTYHHPLLENPPQSEDNKDQ